MCTSSYVKPTVVGNLATFTKVQQENAISFTKMKLLISKIYGLYKRNGNPNPEFKLVVYLAMILYLVSWCILMLCFSVIDFYYFDKKAKLNSIVIIGVSLFVGWMLYKLLFKALIKQRRLKRWETMYSNVSVSSLLLYLILILLPLLLLLLGPVLATWLTGGEILGHRINGLLEKPI
jgi:hypothetical protein